MTNNPKRAVNAPPGEEAFEVLFEEPLPPVNEFKRFMKVFLHRKVVVVGLVFVIIILVAGLFSYQIAPHDPFQINLLNNLQPPSSEFLLGTDDLGRCLLSRIIHGARLALITGVSTVFISSAIGSVLGLVAGFAGKVVEDLIMRLTDAWLSLPPLIIMMFVGVILGRGVVGIVFAVALGMFPGYIRLVYGQVMTVKQNDYIMASLAMGDSKMRIIFRHILPNCITPLIVTMTMSLGGAVMAEAGLSFIGLGLAPPSPAWGTMTNDGYMHLAHLPLLSLAPSAALVLLVFGFNMVGDGIRDALDPKMRGTME